MNEIKANIDGVFLSMKNLVVTFIPADVWLIILEYGEFLNDSKYSLVGLTQLSIEFASNNLNKLTNRDKAAVIYDRLSLAQKKERNAQLAVAFDKILISLNENEEKLVNSFFDKILVNIPLKKNRSQLIQAFSESSERYPKDFLIDTLKNFTTLKEDQILRNLLVNFTYLSVGESVLKNMPVMKLSDPTFVDYEFTPKRPWRETIYYLFIFIICIAALCQNYFPLPNFSWWTYLIGGIVIGIGGIEAIQKLCSNQPSPEFKHKLSISRTEHFLTVKKNLDYDDKAVATSSLKL